MIIYIDNDFRCYTEAAPDRREQDVSFFNGKCAEYIEGYRFIPAGESWTREDGEVFTGETVSPWKPYSELDAAQRKYEREQLEDMRKALSIVGVSDT